MSISQETQRLNSLGQIGLGVAASLSVNLVVHPISTVQSCMMANSTSVLTHRMGISQLYKGYWAICATDAIAFSTAYVVNDALCDRVSPLSAACAAGLFSAPVICVGEGLARNGQVNGLLYRESVQRSLRIRGLGLTALREIPFTVGVFFLSPLLQRQILQQVGTGSQYEFSAMGAQASAGILAGAIAGFVTSPIELIKTRVQTSEQPLTIAQIVRSVAYEGGCRGFFRGGGMRSLYVGLATAGMNIVSNTAPHFFPKILYSEE